jgi:hypothetical protein
MIRSLVYIAIFVLAATGTTSAQAGLVINEVMADEPGGSRSLEWIELYNDSPDHDVLLWYDLRFDSDTGTVTIPLAGNIPRWSYLIYCRNIDRFEEHWGDSSGVWGDHPSETYLISQLPPQFPPLRTDGGWVQLYHMTRTLWSELSWSESGEDGHSWERVHPATDQIMASSEFGGTPGLVNSLMPMGTDLALASIEVTRVNSSARLVFEIVNRGLTEIPSAFLDLFHFDESIADSLGVLVASEPIGQVDSGITVMLVGEYQFVGHYQKLIARVRLAIDDRPGNNKLVVVAPGSSFPPIRLSEVQVNSPHPFGSEWVELENVGDTAIDLSGWQIGDSIRYTEIASDSLMLPAGAFLVLAQDKAGFGLEFPLFTGLVHEPASWRQFNNGSDSVRLLDLYELSADRFYYDDNPDDGRTWSRSSTGAHIGEWGRSQDEGGTPGEVNRVRFEPEGSQTLNITITPQILSPDGDGRDDSTVIVVTTSDASTYVLRLYDSQGRRVKTFEDHSRDLAQSYVWYGRDDSGQKLPIGIYILYFEATGLESIKKTVVLAR